MHKCVRCGRSAASLKEINDGCPCGSKVFVFNREAVGTSIAGEEVGPKGGAASVQVESGADAGAGKECGAVGPSDSGKAGNIDGKAPESSFARMAFTDEDVENIKVITEGVFSIDLHALDRDPVVLKDEEGVYYVRIPFEQREGKQDGNGKKNNGKK